MERTTIRVKGRLHYEHIYEKFVFENSNDIPRYYLTLLIPKTDKTMIDICANGQKHAINHAIKENIVKSEEVNNAIRLKEFNNILVDGDKKKAETSPEFAGHYYLNAKVYGKEENKLQAPELLVYDANHWRNAKKGELYNGCDVVVELDLFCYKNMQIGIGARIVSVSKISDNKPFEIQQTRTLEENANELNAFLREHNISVSATKQAQTSELVEDTISVTDEDPLF